MAESGVAFLRKYSEAARHSKPIKVSYVILWYCATGSLVIMAGIYITKLVVELIKDYNSTAT